ncbi:MAG: hypothetical protein Q8O25_14630 [Sulfurisoma sp.]|nr:hypothetical protein [Sulfurisoma sp.]
MLVAFCVVAATGYEIVDQRRDIRAQAERDLVGFNVALAAHTEEVIASADIVLSDVALELSRGNVAAMGSAVLRSHVHGHASGMPMAVHILVTDAAGRVLAHSRHKVPPGVALFPVHGGDGEALLLAADRALYRAKETGRNRCVMATA